MSFYWQILGDMMLELLNDDLKELEADIRIATANLNAVTGAANYIKGLIVRLDAETKKEGTNGTQRTQSGE